MKQIINRASRASWIFRLISFSCLILIPFAVQASELTEQEVQAAVQTWVRSVTADAKPDAVIEIMEPYIVYGETVAYIAHLQGGGFCLTGADNLVLPVYLYSPQRTYDPEDPNYQYVLWEIAERTKGLRKASREYLPIMQEYQEALAERASFWQKLIAGRAPMRMEGLEALTAKAEPNLMTLDFTSHWHQSSPYNDQCPLLTPPDEHTLVGCVATAMAQTMYYWRWPNTGVGSNSITYNYRWRNTWDEEPLATDPNITPPSHWVGRLEWTAANGGRLRMNGYWDGSKYNAARNLSSDNDYRVALENLWNRLTSASTNYPANFGATNYNWSVMQDTHTDPSDDGDPEVAKLNHHAGVAVNMNYGIGVSTSGSGAAVNAMENNFRYDQDAIVQNKNANSINLLTEEIQWLRPVLLGGCRPTGGCHEWVTLGYNKGTDPNRQFYMNFGNGAINEWYSLDSVTYSELQDHITGLAPLNVVRFVGNTSPGDGSPDNPHRDIDEALGSVPNGGTLIFEAGSTNTFSGSSLVIDRPLTLKGKNAVIQ